MSKGYFEEIDISADISDLTEQIDRLSHVQLRKVVSGVLRQKKNSNEADLSLLKARDYWLSRGKSVIKKAEIDNFLGFFGGHFHRDFNNSEFAGYLLKNVSSVEELSALIYDCCDFLCALSLENDEGRVADILQHFPPRGADLACIPGVSERIDFLNKRAFCQDNEAVIIDVHDKVLSEFIDEIGVLVMSFNNVHIVPYLENFLGLISKSEARRKDSNYLTVMQYIPSELLIKFSREYALRMKKGLLESFSKRANESCQKLSSIINESSDLRSMLRGNFVNIEAIPRKILPFLALVSHDEDFSSYSIDRGQQVKKILDLPKCLPCEGFFAKITEEKFALIDVESLYCEKGVDCVRDILLDPGSNQDEYLLALEALYAMIKDIRGNAIFMVLRSFTTDDLLRINEGAAKRDLLSILSFKIVDISHELLLKKSIYQIYSNRIESNEVLNSDDLLLYLYADKYCDLLKSVDFVNNQEILKNINFYYEAGGLSYHKIVDSIVCRPDFLIALEELCASGLSISEHFLRCCLSSAVECNKVAVCDKLVEMGACYDKVEIAVGDEIFPCARYLAMTNCASLLSKALSFTSDDKKMASMLGEIESLAVGVVDDNNIDILKTLIANDYVFTRFFRSSDIMEYVVVNSGALAFKSFLSVLELKMDSQTAFSELMDCCGEKNAICTAIESGNHSILDFLLKSEYAGPHILEDRGIFWKANSVLDSALFYANSENDDALRPIEMILLNNFTTLMNSDRGEVYAYDFLYKNIAVDSDFTKMDRVRHQDLILELLNSIDLISKVRNQEAVMRFCELRIENMREIPLCGDIEAESFIRLLNKFQEVKSLRDSPSGDPQGAHYQRLKGRVKEL